MIQKRILELTEYGLQTGLIRPEDQVYTVNRLLELFGLDELGEDCADSLLESSEGIMENPGAYLENILDDDEFEAVSDAFDEWLDACEYDELVEEDEE